MALSPENLLEYSMLWSGCGFVELRDWSSITVTGADRQTFLNSFCTNDVKKLLPAGSCEAFFTNVKGKIVGHGLVTCRENELVFVGAPGQAVPLIAHLERYIIREDVQLKDATNERAYVLIVCGDEADLFPKSLGGDRSGEHWLKSPVEVMAKLGQIPVRWIPWKLLNRQTCGLMEFASEDAFKVRLELEHRQAMQCEKVAFEARRIEAGFPLYGLDFDEHNLPQEVGRDAEAISFTKGCYLGQETVARIDAMGHVNQQLCGVRFFGGLLEKRAELKEADVVVGRVSSSTFSPQLNSPLALAMLRRAASAVGSKLESPVGGCEVVKLPVDDINCP